MIEDPAQTLSVVKLLEEHPGIFDTAEHSCAEEDIAEVEEVLGQELPEDLLELYRVSDGGVIHSASRQLQLIPLDQLASLLERVFEDMETVPIAHDDEGMLLVLDAAGEWGGAPGAIYRLQPSRRQIRGHAMQDAVRVADSVTELLTYVAQGRDAW
mgnify:CR=1 FL=1